MKVARIHIALLLVLASCDSMLRPEVVSIEGESLPQPDDGFICVLQPEVIPRLLTPMDSLWADFTRIAAEKGHQEKAIVQFTVTKTGEVEDPEVIHGGNKFINEDVLRIIRNARFKPAKQRGKPVAVRYSLPLNFSK